MAKDLSLNLRDKNYGPTQLKDGKKNQIIIIICRQWHRPPGDGHSRYFCTGVCHFKVSVSTLSRIFDEKAGPFLELMCLMEVSEIRFLRLFGGKMASIFQTFSVKLWIFSQSSQSVRSSFGFSFVSSK